MTRAIHFAISAPMNPATGLRAAVLACDDLEPGDGATLDEHIVTCVQCKHRVELRWWTAHRDPYTGWSAPVALHEVG